MEGFCQQRADWSNQAPARGSSEATTVYACCTSSGYDYLAQLIGVAH